MARTWRDKLSNPLRLGGKNSAFARTANWLADPLETGMWDMIDKKQGGPSPETYLDKVPGILQETYGPYMQHGQQAYPELSQTYGSMSEHPDQYIQHIMDQFSSSPQYQQQLNAMLESGQNASAQGGMTGDVGGQAHLADMLSSDNMQQWLKNVSDIQGQGIQGQQHFYDTGFDASKNYSGDLANMMQTSAGLGMNRARDSNQSQSDKMSALFQAAGLGAGYLAGRGKKNIIDNGQSPQTGYPYAPQYPYA